jgi:hypothetical protein
MQVTNLQKFPINDFLRDDMLLKVMDSNPWYTNIVNYMVSGYVPPGENRRTIWKPMSPLGWSISVPGLFRWPAEEMCNNSQGTANHWKMPCSTVRRPLWIILHTSQNLAVWVLLANNVRGHQRIHPKVSEVLVPRKHQLSQCDAPTLQPSNRNIWCVEHWLHGAISKVPRLRVHPCCFWLRVKMGGSTTVLSCWC